MARISVDVELDEFDDDDIIEAVIDRKLGAEVLSALAGGEHAPLDALKSAQDVYRSLTTRQYARAQAEMRRLLEALLPPAIVAAEQSIREGRFQQAICDLDKFFPSQKLAPPASKERPSVKA